MSNLTPSSVTPSESLRNFINALPFLSFTVWTRSDREAWECEWKIFDQFLCREGDVHAEAFIYTMRDVLRQHNDYSQRRRAHESIVTLASVLRQYNEHLALDTGVVEEPTEEASEVVVELFTLLIEDGHLSIGSRCHDAEVRGEFLRSMEHFLDNRKRLER